MDGNSFAHRAFHALPKSIRRTGDRGGGAIVGFANFLLRLYKNERPRAVLVGWDTLGSPTYRQRLFPAYQSGRHFDEELVDQLSVLPQFITACGFANAKAPGYEADDFLAAAVDERSGAAVACWSPVGIAMRFSSPPPRPSFFIRSRAVSWRASAPMRCASAMRSSRIRCPTSSLCGAILPTSFRAHAEVGPKGAAVLLRQFGTLEQILAEGRFREQATELKLYRKIATMDATAPLPALR